MIVISYQLEMRAVREGTWVPNDLYIVKGLILMSIVTVGISYLSASLAERDDMTLLLARKNDQLVMQETQLREAKMASEVRGRGSGWMDGWMD